MNWEQPNATEGEWVIIWPTKRWAVYRKGEYLVDVEGKLEPFGWTVTRILRIINPF